MSEQVVHIPFHKLTISPRNVRVVSTSNDADNELLATLRSVGLLQNLVVAPTEEGDLYEVAAGGRRYAGLSVLVELGEKPADYPVACKVISRDEIEKVSLIENMRREAMHPADEFVTYGTLVAQGNKPQDIADIMGVKKNYVEKLLQLSKVAPEIVQAFRAGKLDQLSQVIAFSVTDDLEKQLACYEALRRTHNLHHHTIRRYLTDTYMKTTAPIVKFVSLATYRKAGGTTSKDLFQNETYIHDVALIQKLATEKLEKVCGAEGEGWAWTAVAFSHQEANSVGRQVSADYVDVPEELDSEIKAIEKERDAIDERAYTDDWSDADEQRDMELADKLEDLEAKRESYRAFTDAQRAIAGAVVFIGNDGKPQVLKGVVRKEDEKALKAVEKGEVTATSKDEEPAESAALRADLDAYFLQAFQRVLLEREDVAFDMLIFTLADRVLGSGRFWGRLLGISAEPVNFKAIGIEETLSAMAFQKALEGLSLAWMDLETQKERWEAFCGLSKSHKQKIMTYCVARTAHTPRSRVNEDSAGSSILKEIDFKLADHWQPTKENYYQRVTKNKLLDIGAKQIDAQWADDHQKTQKSLIADLLPTMDQLKGWVPEYLES